MDAQKQSPKLLWPVFKWLRIFFLLYIVAEFISILATFLMFQSGSVMFGPEETYHIGDYIEGVNALVMLVVFLGSIIFFSIFSYRSVKNLELLGQTEMTITPGWAVGWYFVPLAHLWKPYGAMTDIWYGTHSGEHFAEQPKTLPLWWLCWVFSLIIDRISFRLGRKAGFFEEHATDVELYKTTLYMDVVSSVLGILAAWMILRIVHKITITQDKRIHSDVFD